MSDFQGLSEAADELNRRLVRSNRSRTRIVLTVTVVAGLSVAVGVVLLPGFQPSMGVFGWLTAAVVVGLGFAAAVGGYAVADLVTRALGRRLEKRWQRELAAERGVAPEALAEMSLPLGDQPVPSGVQARRQLQRRTLAIAALGLAAVVVVMLAFGLRELLLMGLIVVLVVTVAAIMHAYLGWRPPR